MPPIDTDTIRRENPLNFTNDSSPGSLDTICLENDINVVTCDAVDIDGIASKLPQVPKVGSLRHHDLLGKF